MSNMNTHFFTTEDADNYGVVPAVLLYNLRYLQQQKESKGRGTHEGKHWVNYSYQALSKRFSYLSVDQIKRAMKKLLDSGAVVNEQLSPNRWDRTLYWHVTDMAICTTASSDINSSERAISPTLIHENNITSTATPKFDEFWSAYPKKLGKKKSQAKFSKLTTKQQETAVANVMERAKSDGDWLEGYAPHPITYLNGERWEDEWEKIESVKYNPNDPRSFLREAN